MKREGVVYPLLSGLVLSLAVAHFAFGSLNGWLNILTALGTVGAVVVSLFHDQIKDAMHPYKAEVELAKDGGLYEDEVSQWVYHLRVRNLTEGRPLQGCYVVLTGIKREGVEEDRFPVERFFPWAPAESREQSITLFTERTVDFARVTSPFFDPTKPYRFSLEFFKFFNEEKDCYEPQGGKLEAWVNPTETVRFRVEVRAQGFQQTHFVTVCWTGGLHDDMSKHLKINVGRAE